MVSGYKVKSMAMESKLINITFIKVDGDTAKSMVLVESHRKNQNIYFKGLLLRVRKMVLEANFLKLKIITLGNI